MSSTLLTVAARELRDRSRLLAVAAAFAVVPFIAAALPAARSDRPTVLAIASAVLAVSLGVGSAIALGSSVIGRDLSERRLSFHFTRPIGVAAIWFGRAGAALLSSLGAFAIIFVPAWLATRGVWPSLGADEGTIFLLVPAAIVILFLLSHTLSTMVRSKSVLIGLDFILAVLSGVAAWKLVWPLVAGGGMTTAGVIALSASALVVLVLAVAPLNQLSRGRTDVRRNHRALSAFLWSGVGVALLLSGAAVLWVLSATPDDLERIYDIDQSPAGAEAFVTGKASGRGDFQPAFIVNGASGDYTRVNRVAYSNVEWSRDGRTAAWLELDALTGSKALELQVRRAGDTRTTGLRAGLRADFVLSDDGRRVALLDAGLLSVYEIDSKRLLTSAGGVHERDVRAMFFIRPDVLRIVTITNAAPKEFVVSIFELEVEARKLTRLGGTIFEGTSTLITAAADGSRLLIGPMILDGRSGAVIAQLPRQSEGNLSPRMLNDGTVAAMANGGGHRMLLYDRNGVKTREIPLPPAARSWIVGELPDGRLIAMGADGAPGEIGNSRMMVIDRNRATLERTLEGLHGPDFRWSDDSRMPVYAARGPLVGVDRAGALVSWNPSTGDRKKL